MTATPASHIKFVYLHIGKTGGTYIKNLFQANDIGETQGVAVTTHRYTLAHALVKWPEAKSILTIRSPIDIFRSAFVSRKNQGWPGHDSPHTAQENIVFSHFDSAGELATALDSEDKIRRDLAVLSMENIRHVGKCLKWYLQGVKFLRNNKDRIARRVQPVDATLYLSTKRWSVSNGLPNTNQLHSSTEGGHLGSLATRRVLKLNWPII